MKKFLSILIVAVMLVGLMSACGEKEYINKGFVTKDFRSPVIYETVDKNVTWGTFQKNYEDVQNAVELRIGTEGYIKSEEEFVECIKIAKARLDALESNYAFGYNDDNGGRFYAYIEKEKLGLATFGLLNVYGASDCKIVSQMKDLEIGYVENASYRINENSKIELTVEVPESDRESFGAYIKDNIGMPLYLQIGKLTYSSTTVTESMASDKVTFTGLMFIGSGKNEADYEFFGKLAQTVINNAECGYSTALPEAIDQNDEYPIEFVTYMDECVKANIAALYDDVRVGRWSLESSIFIIIDGEKYNLSDEEYLDRVEEIYRACEFEKGAYSEVVFKLNLSNGVTFQKKDGEMVCVYYDDNIATLVEAHPFISELIP